MTSLKKGKSQTLPIQLELPLTPQTIDPLKQMQEAIQHMLDLIWKCVLAHIAVRSTKELMRQHGKLVALADGGARIRMSSAPVFRLALEKLPDVELAFQKAFGTMLKISLQV